MSGGAGWHEDPTRRHQVRWWDGTRWTDWVGDNGQTSQDPLAATPATPTPPVDPTPAPAPSAPGAVTPASAGAADPAAVEHLLSRRRLAFECGGSSFSPPGWRNVFDDAGALVGRIDRRAHSLSLCDPAGAAFLDVEATLIGWSSRHEVSGVRVSAAGQHLVDVGFRQMRDITFTAKRGGDEVVSALFGLTMGGAITGASVQAPDGRIVATIAQQSQVTPGMVGAMWLMLDKDPALPELHRLVTVAMPLVFDVFSFRIGSG